MRFAAPEYLVWLWGLLPLLALLLLSEWWRGRQLARFAAGAEMRRQLAAPLSRFKRILGHLLLTAAVGCILLALARPQWGTRMENVTLRGVDVMIAVDTSLSMNTPDVPPNRLALAKEELLALIQRIESARVGIISFAGSAFLQCPLTIDRAAAGLFLDILDTGLIPDPGTNLGAAIDLARQTFQRHQQKHKVLILITDGENLSGDPLAEARRAAEEGVVIYTIGVGTPSGQPIPVRNERGDVVDYKKDENGSAVISRLDESTLAEIARIGQGRYYRATALSMEVDDVAREIDGMEKKELQSRMVHRYNERFQIPLALALLGLALEGLLSDRRRALRDAWAQLRTAWRDRRFLRRGSRPSPPARETAAGHRKEP
jgi:Ca-activated chloride channel family protein